MTNQSFARYHLIKALLSGLAETDGEDIQSRRLRAQAKLRLITMSDRELQELAEITASPPEKPVEQVFSEHKRNIEKLKATTSEWLTDLQLIEHPTEKIPKKIILFESDPHLSQHLIATLCEAGFSVTQLSFFLATMLILDEINPDMFIIDESLPEKDGIEVCSRLRAIFDAPTILLGKDASGSQWARAVKAGADFYLQIPCSDRVLVARVNTLFRRYKEVSDDWQRGGGKAT